MLRPDSAVEATAIFDSVQFAEVANPPAGGTTGQPSVTGHPAPNPAAQALAAAGTPIKLANVKPAPQPQQARQTNGDSGTPAWPIALAVVLPGALAAGAAWGIGRRHAR